MSVMMGSERVWRTRTLKFMLKLGIKLTDLRINNAHLVVHFETGDNAQINKFFTWNTDGSSCPGKKV